MCLILFSVGASTKLAIRAKRYFCFWHFSCCMLHTSVFYVVGVPCSVLLSFVGSFFFLLLLLFFFCFSSHTFSFSHWFQSKVFIITSLLSLYLLHVYLAVFVFFLVFGVDCSVPEKLNNGNAHTGGILTIFKRNQHFYRYANIYFNIITQKVFEA